MTNRRISVGEKLKSFGSPNLCFADASAELHCSHTRLAQISARTSWAVRLEISVTGVIMMRMIVTSPARPAGGGNMGNSVVHLSI